MEATKCAKRGGVEEEDPGLKTHLRNSVPPDTTKQGGRGGGGGPVTKYFFLSVAEAPTLSATDMYAPPSTSAPLAALSNGANAKSVSPVPSAPPPPQQQQPSSQPPPPYATLPPQQQQLQLQQQQLLLQQQHYVLPPYPSSAQSILQQMQKGSTGGAGGKAPWTPGENAPMEGDRGAKQTLWTNFPALFLARKICSTVRSTVLLS